MDNICGAYSDVVIGDCILLHTRRVYPLFISARNCRRSDSSDSGTSTYQIE